MCTLTYLLNDDGYELFFNRDEQRTRPLAITPAFNPKNQAIYPIDPQGQGTWIATHKNGTSLALLNYYQGQHNVTEPMISRGQLILTLLTHRPNNVIDQLNTLNLCSYQPFTLCIFPNVLSTTNPSIHIMSWNGQSLSRIEEELPITSSSVDFVKVQKQRKIRFNKEIDTITPSSNDFKRFHFSKETNTKYSVNMERQDAKTVSFSHINVNQEQVAFDYYDNVNHKHYSTSCIKHSY